MTDTLKIEARGECETAITRLFDAPPTLVFDAWTKPELIKRWMGPEGFVLSVCEIDLRVGGQYSFGGRKGIGPLLRWGGTYREIAKPARIVQTDQFLEPFQSPEALSTVTFAAQDGKTLFTQVTRYVNTQTRDLALNSGMEHGVRQGFDKMDAVLAEMG
jgi:uncharacterized protein YndB with AHSA1/START domain